jgi:hypothetical protein
MSDMHHNQFLGRYQAEFMPMWDLVEVARQNNDTVLLLRTPADTKTIPLQTEAQTLQGQLFDNGCTGYVTISLDEDTQRPVISLRIETEDPKLQAQIPDVLRFHKTDPRPPRPSGDRVKAADLVQQVRDSEQWIHQIQTLRWSVRTHSIRTPESLRLQERQIKQRHPEEDLTNKRFWGLMLEQPGQFFLSMDRSRLRWREAEDQRYIRDHLWDGETFYASATHFTHEQEQITIRPTLGDGANFLLSGMAWPRAQHHRFWWQTDMDCGCATDPATEAPPDRDPASDTFTLIGQESFRDTPCYVLDCIWTGERWYVAIANGLLYGKKVYNGSGLVSHYWMEDYQEVKPGGWFPMQQGYELFKQERGQSIACGTRRIIVEEIEVDEPLPEDDFKMPRKEGVRTFDLRFGGMVDYRYKENRTTAEWQEIRQRAQKRQDEDSAIERQWEALRGQPAPDFPLSSQWLNSPALTWTDLQGQTVVLLFWSQDCGPCQNHIADMTARKHNEPIILIGVHSPATNLEAIQALLDTHDADGPVCVDVSEPDSCFGQLSRQFHMHGVPCFVVVGPDSRVAGHTYSIDKALQMAHDASNT